MSNIESLVTSLQKSKELKAAGFPQAALYYWEEDSAGGKLRPSARLERDENGCPTGEGWYAAFFAEEILQRLVEVNNIVITPAPFAKGGWRINHDVRCGSAFSDTLANAAAAMYCYLDSNNLLPKA